jgi:UDP-N-acetylmuramoyl-L-alanyl-D-glutamate--2,6-diaminopimelate ligase
MELRELLRGIEALDVGEDGGRPIHGLHYDSRRVQPGYAFFAVRGEKTDGNRFVWQAVERGAAAVVSAEPMIEGLPAAWVRVRDARKALALASANFYGHPSRGLRLAGITGTNGKTTTAFLLESVLLAAGKHAGLFGTIEYHLPGAAGAPAPLRRLPAPNTTPESLDLQAYLAELRDLGGTHVVMEVSSHALALDRVYGCTFHTAVFTNLSRDHLDFHGTMEAYFAEKRKLFQGWGAEPPQWAVLNADDAAGAELAGCRCPNVLWYGFGAKATVRPAARNPEPASGCFVAETPWGPLELGSSLLGRPNVCNLLAAAGAALALGFSRGEVERGLSALENVPGRFERVEAGQPFLVLVDYAHTDDALRSLIGVARGLVRPCNRVITLFGCGGDRDRSKRPLMGEAAASLSDLVILTSDNPRSEDPMAIINDALPGVRNNKAEYRVEPDRARAIALAIGLARPGDIVLLAGKGHEDYQVIGAETIHFDDREAALEVLHELGFVR